MAEIFNLEPLMKLDDLRTYLVLISPTDIPHVSMVCQGKYYSLTNREVISGQPFIPYQKAMNRTRRKQIYLDLGVRPETPEKVFATFTTAMVGGASCLTPVAEFLLPGSSAEFIFDLVPELYAAQMIQHAYHVYLEDELNVDNGFELRRYSRKDINSYIQSENELYERRISNFSAEN